VEADRAFVVCSCNPARPAVYGGRISPLDSYRLATTPSQQIAKVSCSMISQQMRRRRMKYYRVHADQNGDSHSEEV